MVSLKGETWTTTCLHSHGAGHPGVPGMARTIPESVHEGLLGPKACPECGDRRDKGLFRVREAEEAWP